jgi:hypothetical protein
LRKEVAKFKELAAIRAEFSAMSPAAAADFFDFSPN